MLITKCMKFLLHLIDRIKVRFIEKNCNQRIKRGKRVRCSAAEGLFPEAIEIGDDFINAPGATILTHDASLLLFTRKMKVKKTIIGNQVFLGLRSIVMPGVHIGNKVIVGAGAIVTKDVPDNSVVAGNPARIICTVDEYVDKCNKQNDLYDIPDSYLKVLDDNGYFTSDIQNDMRLFVYSQMRTKEME